MQRNPSSNLTWEHLRMSSPLSPIFKTVTLRIMRWTSSWTSLCLSTECRHRYILTCTLQLHASQYYRNGWLNASWYLIIVKTNGCAFLSLERLSHVLRKLLITVLGKGPNSSVHEEEWLIVQSMWDAHQKAMHGGKCHLVYFSYRNKKWGKRRKCLKETPLNWSVCAAPVLVTNSKQDGDMCLQDTKSLPAIELPVRHPPPQGHRHTVCS